MADDVENIQVVHRAEVCDGKNYYLGVGLFCSNNALAKMRGVIIRKEYAKGIQNEVVAFLIISTGGSLFPIRDSTPVLPAHEPECVRVVLSIRAIPEPFAVGKPSYEEVRHLYDVAILERLYSEYSSMGLLVQAH